MSRRVLELDALRGITAFVIVLAHLGHMVESAWIMTTIDFFFVLSGYFITLNVLAGSGSPNFFRVFYIRRGLRIWPAYYVALAACLVLNSRLKWDQPPDAWPYYLTFTQNVQAYLGWPLPRFSGMFLHTWTLAIEEQFYLLWPLLVYLAGRKYVVPLIVPFFLAPIVLRSLGFLPYLLLTRCDGLALGALLAVLVGDRGRLDRHATAFRLAFALIAVVGLGAPALSGVFAAPPQTDWPSAFWPRLLYSVFMARACVVYFAAAGLVLCFQGHPRLALLRDRRLCYTGQVSYGLYLYHPLVFATVPQLYRRYVFRYLGLRSTLLMDLVQIAICFALAELSRRLLERPFLALKDRFKYARPVATPAPALAVAAEPGPLLKGPHTRPSQVPSARPARERETS
jgi:peptidoglycan/LPS O-acetylase OafA/YrhL